jgi:predicted ABC-type ATPase
MPRRIISIAGPNGAGKTTFARSFLPREGGCLNFINADLIAAGLAPLQPETVALHAGRLMLEEMHRFVEGQQSFAVETTLSGRSYSRQIPVGKSRGFRVDLIYLKLRSIRLAVTRVKARVAQVDSWEVYDNSGNIPVLLEHGTNP